MRIKNFIKTTIILIITVTLLAFGVKIVLADTSGWGGITPGSAGSTSGSGGWDTSFGYYVAVYDKNDNQKGSVADITDIPSGWIVKNESDEWVSDPEKLYDSLNIPYGSTSGNYSGLLSKIKADAKPLGSGDYVVIEPYTKIYSSKVTFRNISDTSTEVSIIKDGTTYTYAYYEAYHVPAVALANAAKVGKTIKAGSYTFTEKNDKCTYNTNGKDKYSTDFCEYNSNKSVGYGLTVVRYEDMNGSLTITKLDDANSAVGGAGFTLYSDSTCDTISQNERSTGSDGKVTFSNLTPGSTYSYKETTVPDGYVGDTTCHSSGAIVANKDTSKTVKNDRKGKITIIKKNNLGNSPENDEAVSKAGFKVYSDKRCEGTAVTTLETDSKGEDTSGWLVAGTYYLREDPIKTGYHGNPFYWNGTQYIEDVREDNINGRSNCHQITVSKGGTTTLYIKNKTNCEYEMDKAGLDPYGNTSYINNPTAKQKLIDIYLYLKNQKNNDFRNLLNFGGPSCTAHTPIVSLNRACTLTTITSGVFNENNLSNYQKVETIGEGDNAKNALCVINYNLDTSFLEEYNNKNDNPVEAGRVIFQGYQADNGKLASSRLTETCYAFNTGIAINNSTSFGDYTDKPKDLYKKYIDYETNPLNILDNRLTITSISNDFKHTTSNKFKRIINVSYSKTNYIKKISGLDGDEDCFNNKLCIKVGGINTKYKAYNENNPYNTTYEFMPIVTITGDYKDILGINRSQDPNWDDGDGTSICKFKFKDELITYNKNVNPKYKMNLEFRIINTQNPFPGKAGNGRVIGENWCGDLLENGMECTSAYKDGVLNKLVDYTTSATISDDVREKIINAPSSNSTCPKYKIELTPSTINSIREYNKSHSYSEYDLDCADGTCENKFLKEFNIKESTSECTNGTNEEFVHHDVERNCTTSDYSTGTCLSINADNDNIKEFYNDYEEIYAKFYEVMIESKGQYQFELYSGNCISDEIYKITPSTENGILLDKGDKLYFTMGDEYITENVEGFVDYEEITESAPASNDTLAGSYGQCKYPCGDIGNPNKCLLFKNSYYDEKKVLYNYYTYCITYGSEDESTTTTYRNTLASVYLNNSENRVLHVSCGADSGIPYGYIGIEGHTGSIGIRSLDPTARLIIKQLTTYD